MKKNLLMLFFVFLTISCNDDASTQQNSSIAKENDLCICTKEFMPVCGNNGITYGNKCEAGCAKITEFTDGACKEN